MKLIGFATVSIIVLTWMCAARAADVRVYVSNERSGDISVIDAARWEVLATIPVGKRPRGILPSHDGRTLYVALSGTPITPPGTDRATQPPADKSADGIGVVDLASGRLVKKLTSGSDPEQFSLSRDGSSIYISNEDVNTATVLDVTRGEPIKTLPVGVEPEGVATTPDGRFVYVTAETDNRVDVIDTSTDEIVAQISTAQRPRSVAFLPDSSKGYVTCETAGVVCVVDVTASKVIKKIKHDGESVRPMGVTISPDGRRAYVTTGRGKSVLVIDTARDEVEAVVEDVGARPWGVCVTPDGRFLYTANGPSNDVAVIDTAALKVVHRINAGTSPWGIAVIK